MTNRIKSLIGGLAAAALVYGCQTAPKTIYQVLDGVNAASQVAWGEYVTYRASAAVPASTDATVVKAFNQLQADELLVLDATTNGTTVSLTTIQTDLSDISAVLTTAGVTNFTLNTNL